MTIENNTPSWEEKQVQTMSGSEKELVLESEELANIDREKGEKIREATVETSLGMWDLLNSFLESKKIDRKIIDDPFAYAEENIVQKWNREHGVKPLETIG